MLKLAQDRFGQIELPTFTDVTRPGAVSGLTGMLMDRPDLYGGLAGKASMDTIKYLTDASGTFLDDPRVPPELRGKNTLGRDALQLQGSIQQWKERTDARDFGAQRSDQDRLFAENQRVAIDSQIANDTKMSAQYGVPIINGRQASAWEAKNMDWIHQFMAGNLGRTPTFNELVANLGSVGLRPEDQNGGRPFSGTSPTAVPGVIIDPAHGGYVDAATGKQMNSQEVAQVGRQRSGSGLQISGFDQRGQPIYSSNLTQGQSSGVAGGGIQGDLGPGGMQTQMAGGAQDGIQGDGQVMKLGGGGMVAAPGVVDAAMGRFASGTGLNLGGSGATAGLGAGQLLDPSLRALLEQGRATDIQAQLQYERQQAEAANAAGQLDLARQHETNATALQSRALDLQARGADVAEAGVTGTFNGVQTEQGREFDATNALNQGRETGTVNGQETLSKIGMYGIDAQGRMTLDASKAVGWVGGAPTVEREALYGGSAYLQGGKSLGSRQQEDQTALGLLGLEGQYRGAADIVQYAKIAGGTPQGLRDAVDSAMGRYRAAKYGDFGQGSPQAASVDTVAGQASAGGGNSVNDVNAAMARLKAGPEQFSWQNIDRLPGSTQKQVFALSEGQGRPLEDILAQRDKVMGRYRGPAGGRMMVASR